MYEGVGQGIQWISDVWPLHSPSRIRVCLCRQERREGSRRRSRQEWQVVLPGGGSLWLPVISPIQKWARNDVLFVQKKDINRVAYI